MTPLGYHSSNLSLIALETMRLLMPIIWFTFFRSLFKSMAGKCWSFEKWRYNECHISKQSYWWLSNRIYVTYKTSSSGAFYRFCRIDARNRTALFTASNLWIYIERLKFFSVKLQSVQLLELLFLKIFKQFY